MVGDYELHGHRYAIGWVDSREDCAREGERVEDAEFDPRTSVQCENHNLVGHRGDSHNFPAAWVPFSFRRYGNSCPITLHLLPCFLLSIVDSCVNSTLNDTFCDVRPGIELECGGIRDPGLPIHQVFSDWRFQRHGGAPE